MLVRNVVRKDLFMDTIKTIADLLKLNGSVQSVTVSLTQNETRLIAAAPELLDACKYALATMQELGDDVDSDGEPCSDALRLRNAIDKAEGRD